MLAKRMPHLETVSKFVHRLLYLIQMISHFVGTNIWYVLFQAGKRWLVRLNEKRQPLSLCFLNTGRRSANWRTAKTRFPAVGERKSTRKMKRPAISIVSKLDSPRWNIWTSCAKSLRMTRRELRWWKPRGSSDRSDHATVARGTLP